MKNVQRIDDLSNRRGKIIKSKQAFVVEDTKAFSVSGSDVKEPTKITKTGKGSKLVFIEGMSINLRGDIDLSGGIRMGGSLIIQVEE